MFVTIFSGLSRTGANVVKKSNLRLFDAEKISTHGGSMRFYICKDSAKWAKTDAGR